MYIKKGILPAAQCKVLKVEEKLWLKLNYSTDIIAFLFNLQLTSAEVRPRVDTHLQQGWDGEYVCVCVLLVSSPPSITPALRACTCHRARAHFCILKG